MNITKKNLLLLISNKFKSLLGECIKDKALVDKLSQNIKEDKAVFKKSFRTLCMPYLTFRKYL